MKKLNLLMAVSADGFVARGPSDDMRWTGAEDKALFKALTLSSPHPLLVGRRTHAQMPALADRELVPLSSDPALGITLDRAAELYPGAWLIGGPEVARAALQAGLVGLVYESRVKAKLKEGLPWRPIEKFLQVHPKADFWIDTGVHVRVHGVKRGS
jgi:dihydrofolate reductase